MADWQPGDLALCMPLVQGMARWIDHNQIKGLRAGMVYPVVEVFSGEFFGEAWTALVVSGAKSSWLRGAWNARRFRKVTPPEADAFDREIIDLMLSRKVDA